ncbi:MAG: fused MFS/spermidine synthase, partial [Acidobacteria bacterium]|nr:fused MFS/spermidine synthase [Acidobacteriota bacterium]
MALLAALGLMSASFGANLAARCAILAALLISVRIGGRLGLGEGTAGLSLLACAGCMALLPFLSFLTQPLGAIPPMGAWPAARFLARAGLSLPFLVVPGLCAGVSLERLTGGDGKSANWRMGALDVAVLCAGGSFGSVLAGFQLLPWRGDAWIAFAAAFALFATAVLSGLAGGAASRRSGPQAETPGAGSFQGLILWGITALGLVLAWERALVPIYGPFPELFPRTLALFLVGCAVGSLALALWPYTQPSPLRLPILLMLTGFALALTLTLLNSQPILFLSAAAAIPIESLSFALRIWAVGALLVAPVSAGMGAILPTLMFPSTPVEKPGARDARAGSWAAALAGGMLLAAPLVAFWGLPSLGYERWLCVLAGLLLACAALEYSRAAGASAWGKAAGIFLCLIGTLGVALGLPRGNPKLLSSGVYLYWPEILAKYKTPDLYKEKRLQSDLPFFREGAESTVAVESVVADPSPILAITLDGALAATTFYDLVPQVLSAEIPLLLHPSPEAVFLAGYGSGVPAGSLLLHPLRRLDVAEPEPAVIEASRQFEPANRIPRADPRVRLFFEDPRQVLKSRPRASYDVILSRPSAPQAAAARFLMTREFCRLAATRLKPGGLFAQVVPLQGMDREDVASLLKTLQSSFKDVMVLQTYYFELLFLASDREIRFNLEQMQQDFANEKILHDLTRIGVVNHDSIVIRYRLAGEGASLFARPGLIYADEGAPPRWAGYRMGSASAAEQTLEAMDKFSTGLAQRLEGIAPGPEGNAVLLRLAQSALAVRDSIRAADLGEALLARGDASNGHQVLGDACAIQREQLQAVAEWHKSLEADPENVNALLSLADFNSDRSNYAEAEKYLSQALRIRPEDPGTSFARGRVLYFL